MKVNYKFTGKEVEIKKLEDALDALDAVGCSMNSAYLMNTEIGGGAYSVFVYNALIYNPSYEQFIKRPEEPKPLQNFLYRLFNPFLYKKDNRVRSIIDVYQCTPKEVKKWEGNSNHIEKLFQLSMLLHLKKELTGEAKKTLKGYSDSTREIKGGTEFCLD